MNVKLSILLNTAVLLNCLFAHESFVWSASLRLDQLKIVKLHINNKRFVFYDVCS